MAWTIVSLGGCAWPTWAPADRLARPTPATLDPSAWPAGDPAALRPLLDATPDHWATYVRLEGRTDEINDPYFARLLGSTTRVRFKGIVGRGEGLGLLRVYESEMPPAEEPDPRELMIRAFRTIFTGFEPNAYFLTPRFLSSEERRADLREEDFARRVRSASGQGPAGFAPLTSGEPPEILAYEGVSMRIPRERGAGDTPYRGLVVHLPALAGTEYEGAVVSELESRGWAVLGLRGDRSMRLPPTPRGLAGAAEVEARIFEWIERARRSPEDSPQRASMLREINRLTRERFDLLRGRVEVCPGDDPAPAADLIAREMDERLAEAAYAAEAGIEYLERHRPDVPTRPMVVVGFSAGALAAPTVGARLRDRLDAMVVVGGAADLFTVTQKSEITRGGVRVECGGVQSPAPVIAEIGRLYRERTRLDPLVTARQLVDKPVLQFHAMFDWWVPAEGGRLLTESLGHPDRLTMIGGHQVLFYFLPGYKKRIADWVEANTPPVPPP
ncbi:MAG: hypothetical protein HRU70_02670 [Phycisphaeraceae bacterium]|nr:MAG: hypothetical protein HRU70_02670 [Phycisphaeraceae bacterium]